MVAHVVWSVADKSTCNALVRSLIILHSLLKQSQSYNGILSHRDVILSQIPPIEVAAFVLYFAETSCHKTCAHSKFRPNGLRNCNFFQGISTYAYANNKHFFAEGLHKLLYARNI